LAREIRPLAGPRPFLIDAPGPAPEMGNSAYYANNMDPAKELREIPTPGKTMVLPMLTRLRPIFSV